MACTTISLKIKIAILPQHTVRMTFKLQLESMNGVLPGNAEIQNIADILLSNIKICFHSSIKNKI